MLSFSIVFISMGIIADVHSLKEKDLHEFLNTLAQRINADQDAPPNQQIRYAASQSQISFTMANELVSIACRNADRKQSLLEACDFYEHLAVRFLESLGRRIAKDGIKNLPSLKDFHVGIQKASIYYRSVKEMTSTVCENAEEFLYISSRYIKEACNFLITISTYFLVQFILNFDPNTMGHTLGEDGGYVYTKYGGKQSITYDQVQPMLARICEKKLETKYKWESYSQACELFEKLAAYILESVDRILDNDGILDKYEAVKNVQTNQFQIHHAKPFILHICQVAQYALYKETCDFLLKDHIELMME